METHFTIESHEDGGFQKECLQGKKQKTPTMKYLMCLNTSRGNLHSWETVRG